MATYPQDLAQILVPGTVPHEQDDAVFSVGDIQDIHTLGFSGRIHEMAERGDSNFCHALKHALSFQLNLFTNSEVSRPVSRFCRIIEVTPNDGHFEQITQVQNNQNIVYTHLTFQLNVPAW